MGLVGLVLRLTDKPHPSAAARLLPSPKEEGGNSSPEWGRSHLISGYLLHPLKLAKAASCAFIKLPALVVQHTDDVDAAQLVE